MHTKLVAAFLLFAPFGLYAQTVPDLVRADIKPGQKSLLWTADVNGDGKMDTLIADEEADAEENHQHGLSPDLGDSFHRFTVYLGAKRNEYKKAQEVFIDTDRCYLGKIKQFGRYGVVTLDSKVVDDPAEPQARHGVLKVQVCCFIFENGRARRISLTPWLDDYKKHPIYKMYLADSKRTKLSLQEVAP